MDTIALMASFCALVLAWVEIRVLRLQATAWEMLAKRDAPESLVRDAWRYRALAKNPNPSGRPSLETEGAGSQSTVPSGSVGLGPFERSLVARIAEIAKESRQLVRKDLHDCEEDLLYIEGIAVGLLRDAAHKNPAATVIQGTQPVESGRYTPGTSVESDGGGTQHTKTDWEVPK